MSLPACNGKRVGAVTSLPVIMFDNIVSGVTSLPVIMFSL